MSAFPDPQSLVKATRLPASSHLQKVLVAELQRLYRLPAPDPAPRKALDEAEAGPFERALRRDRASKRAGIIAEYKQASPSLGPFALGTPLLDQLTAYKQGGASCFSILAEPTYFLGDPEHLREAAGLHTPRLYKGFVLAQGHLDEAAACGAEAVLLIARVLKEHTAFFAAQARRRGLEPLVELHDLTEVPFAQAAAARLVGINARDLSTFTLGAPTAAPLREAFPQAVLIRESGLATPEDAVAAISAGFDALLIGEALMRSPDPQGFLHRIFMGLRKVPIGSHEEVAP